MNPYLQGEPVAPVDFFEMEEKWTHEKKLYSDKPEGNAIKTATEIYRKMFVAPPIKSIK